ncbi:MAG: hypothetical protein ACI30I_08745 [Parabacteroides sp.]
MAENLSNYLKALVTLEDLTLGLPIRQKGCQTVQHFSYRCGRSRNSQGKPYGPTTASILHFTLKSLSNNESKHFYRRLQDNETHTFSFLFNATFDGLQLLSDYDDAMVVTGYVIDIEEFFGTQMEEIEDKEQMYMRVDLLVESIEYVGKMSNRTLYTNQ